ncbi:MAG: nickel pincer cofactor biosynthesis protein LarC [Dehalococcoidia bacterium]|nr:MAG: nickel pincer cofactor biosynthesis protein LarC [Dehalococcoidia bacterium]
MFLGLLLDLGVDENALVAELERLEVRFDLSVSQVNKNGIAAISTKVALPVGPEVDEDEEEHVHCDECGHHHGHDEGHVHEHPHDHDHPHDHTSGDDEADEEAQAHGHGMEVSEILAILDRLSEPTRAKAKDMFQALLEAEAQVHGTTVDSVHLHEAGALDAIVEIVGAVKGLELLGVDHVTCGLVNTGTGFAKMTHGTYPVPAPATAELLKGIPIHMDSFAETRKELVTPTGALILRHLVDDFTPISMTVERVGYGAGKRDTAVPNVLRGFLGRSVSAEAPKRLVLLESNIDDMNPELYGNLMDVLYKSGALDVFFTAVQMKKNRPATRISVLGELHSKDVLVQTIMRESTTLGVRVTYPERYEAERQIIDVETELGPARVKLASYGGEMVNVSPEYESCRQLSAQSGVPLKQVYTMVLEAARTHQGAEEESD